jgi:hypothetical protein
LGLASSSLSSPSIKAANANPIVNGFPLYLRRAELASLRKEDIQVVLAAMIDGAEKGFSDHGEGVIGPYYWVYWEERAIRQECDDKIHR